AGGLAVEFDAGFPGGADTAAPVAVNEPAIVVGAFSRATQHQIGAAVDEHVLAAVAVLAIKLRSIPPDRVLDGCPVVGHGPLRRVGGGTGWTVELVVKQEAAGGHVAGRRRRGRGVRPRCRKGGCRRY